MPTDLVVPALGESISEAVIARWLKKVGEATRPDEPVVDLETDKISVQLPAGVAGVLTEQRFAVGATVKVGEIIGRIGESAEAAKAPVSEGPRPEAKRPTPEPTATTPPARQTEPTPVNTFQTSPSPQNHGALSPAKRKALREHGDTSAGSSSPIFAQPPAIAQQPVAQQPVAQQAQPGKREEVVPMTPLRKKIAERLVLAQHSAAILTTFNEVDMTAVMALRARHQDAFVAKHGAKLGFMSFFVKAVVAMLKDMPQLNAEIRGDNIVLKKYYDIGIAVGSGRGLVVPVLRGADNLGFADVEKGITALAVKAKENKLTLDDLAGGTFTITNGGIYGSMMSTPLLNYPQVGILGMHNIVKRAVVVNDAIEIRPMMYVALSYDHRIVDGREAVQFLVGVKERLESPDRLLFEI
jgi:2-oxoglutarate dehydrogenase E2 component (dihydrolipoamide succinyltransferase)